MYESTKTFCTLSSFKLTQHQQQKSKPIHLFPLTQILHKEFLAAELASEDLGIRCVCIDVGMDRLCSRVGWTILPTPCNLLNSFLSWIAFPRCLKSTERIWESGVGVFFLRVFDEVGKIWKQKKRWNKNQEDMTRCKKNDRFYIHDTL